MTQAIRKLPLSLTRLAALGRSDTTNARWPIASKARTTTPSTDRFCAGGDDEQLGGLGRLGAAEHRRGDEPLSRQPACASVDLDRPSATLIVDDDM